MVWRRRSRRKIFGFFFASNFGFRQRCGGNREVPFSISQPVEPPFMRPPLNPPPLTDITRTICFSRRYRIPDIPVISRRMNFVVHREVVL